MKKKLKGLVSLWTATALIAATIIPVAAADITFKVYTGVTEPTEEEVEAIYNDVALQAEHIKEYTVDEDSTLGQITVDKPSKYADELIGWEYWEVVSGEVTDIGYCYKTAFDWVTIGDISPAYLHMPIFSDSRKITTQPTSELPTVVVTHSEDASYQWYVRDEVAIPVIAQNLTGALNPSEMYTYHTDDSYDDSLFEFQLYSGTTASNNGIFSSEDSPYVGVDADQIVDIVLTLAEGWIVKVTPLDGADIKVEDYYAVMGNPGDLTFVEENGSFYATAPSHNTFNPFIYSESGSFDVNIEVINPSGLVEVPGETVDTLSRLVAGERYSCVISWADGYSLTTDTIRLERDTNEGSLAGFLMLFTLTRRIMYYDGDVRIGNDRIWKGNCAENIVPDAKDGYVFGGWYTDAELTSEFDFNTEIYESTTLYAKWLTPEEAAAEKAKEDEAVSDGNVSNDETKSDASEGDTAEA